MKRKLMIVILGLVLMTSLVVANVVISRKNLDSEVELPIDIKETLENHRIISPEFTVDKGDNYWLVSITSDVFNSPNNQIKAFRVECLKYLEDGEVDGICEEWSTYYFTDAEMEIKVHDIVDAKLNRVGLGLQTRDNITKPVPYAEGRKIINERAIVPIEIRK